MLNDKSENKIRGSHLKLLYSKALQILSKTLYEINMNNVDIYQKNIENWSQHDGALLLEMNK